jgi:hypothetical protein
VAWFANYLPRVRLRALAQTSYSPLACIHHYLHMAQGNFREYLKGQRVRTKKYFYVLRPILAINWIECGYGVAPTSFGTLLERLVTDPALQDVIQALILQKTRAVNWIRGCGFRLSANSSKKSWRDWSRVSAPRPIRSPARAIRINQVRSRENDIFCHTRSISSSCKFRGARFSGLPAYRLNRTGFAQIKSPLSSAIKSKSVFSAATLRLTVADFNSPARC